MDVSHVAPSLSFSPFPSTLSKKQWKFLGEDETPQQRWTTGRGHSPGLAWAGLDPLPEMTP